MVTVDSRQGLSVQGLGLVVLRRLNLARLVVQRVGLVASVFLLFHLLHQYVCLHLSALALLSEVRHRGLVVVPRLSQQLEVVEH